MTAPDRRSPGGMFWVVCVLVTLAVAGGLSYLASSSPDGLDAATLRGCDVIDSGGAEELAGQCIAQTAREHALAGSPLADYSVAGVAGSGGLAGVIGVLLTLLVAGGVLWAIARRRPRGAVPPGIGD